MTDGPIDPVAAAPQGRRAPAMPSGCASGGCGSGATESLGDAGGRALDVRRDGGSSEHGQGSFGAHAGVAAAPIRLMRRRRAARSVHLDGIAVNGVEISAQAIAEEAQQHPAANGEAAWAAAARALAIRELLLQEAARAGVVGEPETDEAGRRELDEEATIRALLEREAAPFEPSEIECRRYYDANQQRFRTPDLFEAAHILIEPASQTDADWAAAEHEARTIAEQVGDGREDFAEAARAFSRCPTAHQGGALGQVRRGELLPAVQAAIESLPESTTGRQPVRSPFGWHVLRLDRRIAGRALPFEAVRARIADLLEARSWAVRAAHFTAQLVARADIEGVVLDPAVLEAQAAQASQATQTAHAAQAAQAARASQTAPEFQTLQVSR